MLTFVEAKNRFEDFIDTHPDMIGNIERVKTILAEIAEMQNKVKTALPDRSRVRKQQMFSKVSTI